MPTLTYQTLRVLTAEQHGTILRDGGSLLGKVRAGKTAITVAFYFRYKKDGKYKDISCGTWPRDTLQMIRMNRDAFRLDAAKGDDPAVKQRIDKHARETAAIAALEEIKLKQSKQLTLGDLFAAWLADGVRRENDNAVLKRTFAADVLPVIGNRRLKEITEHDLRAILRALVGRGVNRSAVMMRNNLNQMFRWAQKRSPWRCLLVDGNPVDLIEIQKIVSAEYDLANRRDRTLTMAEIRELNSIFSEMHTAYDGAADKRATTKPLQPSVQHALWIMLATLCRVGETTTARWEHIDWEKNTWFIPKENVKRKVAEHTVYLSDFAINHFRQLHKISGHTEWCFPAVQKEGHLCKKAISKQVGDRQYMFKKDTTGNVRKPMQHRCNDNSLVLAGGVKGAWTPHDLRRTGATMMQALRVPHHVINRCQNHVLEGSKTSRAYLHHTYSAETRDAWKLLGDELSRYIDLPDNVLPLVRSA